MATREQVVFGTFVQLVDSLVEDFDVIELLTVLADRCVELLDAGAAGILLADGEAHLRVMAASDERARLLELFQLQNDEGPCLDCFATGQPVLQDDLGAAGRWSQFSAASVDAGFRSVCALPLRLRENVLGALNLFLPQERGLTAPDVALAQALADVASIAIAQDEAIRTAELRAGQLQHALDSRVAIEQAKGMLAERAQVDMAEAFARLRAYCRRTNSRLTDVATRLVTGALDLRQVVADKPA
ncbi:MAG: GAF and ANTAR domain-containing protein [Acidimicrobiia bacterium]|nr:GAF and ANTAR domain-containing protein [Acidimicrobiia bacterium]